MKAFDKDAGRGMNTSNTESVDTWAVPSMIMSSKTRVRSSVSARVASVSVRVSAMASKVGQESQGKS